MACNGMIILTTWPFMEGLLHIIYDNNPRLYHRVNVLQTPCDLEVTDRKVKRWSSLGELNLA